MIENNDYIESAKKKAHIENIISLFHKYYERPKGLIGILKGNKEILSKDNAYIGLVLMNKIQGLGKKDRSAYWYRPTIEFGSKRHKELEKIGSSSNFWNKGRFPLLQFLFGEHMAPLVKKAWDMIPSLMYQAGYERRSFRGSGLDSIYFVRQLNLIIDLIYENDYNFTLEEYAINSNKIVANNFAFVYAAAIDSGDTSFKQFCLDTIYARHEVARPSRDVIKGMLLSESHECWVAVEKLLLSAQRQEGLRQTILECLDETSLGAMKHLINTIIEHKLTRFSSVVRAIDVWAGFGWDGEKETTVRRFLELANQYLSDPSKIEPAVKSADNAEVYMALWAQGVLDVTKCMPLIDIVLKGNNDKISLALYFMSQIGLSTYAVKYGLIYLHHSDPVIVCQAAELINQKVFIALIKDTEREALFSKLELQLKILPKKTTDAKPRVFSWLTPIYGKEILFDLMIELLDLNEEKNMDRILLYYDDLPLEHRENVTKYILPSFYGYHYNEAKDKPTLTDKKRDFAFRILKDRSEAIKETGLRALAKSTLSSEEIQLFEGYLSRKSADFRKSVIQLIEKHGSKQVKESISRLILAKTEEQRLAGLDLLLWLKKNSPEDNIWLEQKISEFCNRKNISTKEEMVLSGLTQKADKAVEFNEENGFGLFNPEKVPLEIELSKKQTAVLAEATEENKFGLSMPEDEVNKALANLGQLLLEHKDFEYTYEDWDERQTTGLLGNRFHAIKKDKVGMTAEQMFCNYPLHEVWRKWYIDSGLTPRDLLLINLQAKIEINGIGDKDFVKFNEALKKSIFVPKVPRMGEYEWQNPIFDILRCLGERYPYDKMIDFLSDCLMERFANMTQSEAKDFKKVKNYWGYSFVTWRDQPLIKNIWVKYQQQKKKMTTEQFQTYWNLAHWYFLTAPKDAQSMQSYIPELYDYARAFNDKLIEENTLHWRVLQPRSIDLLTQKLVGEQYNIKKEFGFLNEILEKCRNRILEVELIRGDSSTPVTLLAQSINRLYGIHNFVQILKALGKDTLHRGYIYTYGNREYNKKEVLSTLLRNCFPSQECTQEKFNQMVEEAKFSEKRLCEASTYSPQWLPFVAEYLGWKDMESAVWWLHAHTNGHHDAQTETEIAKYSSVEITAFKDGAVDIDWFKETYKSLGKERWKKLYDSAKYISDGGGHKRGLLYADVILGNTKITEITERIKSKRNQDYLRVYGVVPLSKKNPAKDVLRRYQFLQNFKKESKQFGSQRQASEGIAIRISMENLARTAGYTDPIRLQWGMETKEAQEIIENAAKLQLDDIEVKLEIDSNGKSSIVAIKNGKKLKSVPAKYKKAKEVVKLKEFNKTLAEQYRRTRKSLEVAMNNGDMFSKEEIETLIEHPVVSPMLKKLVLVSNNNMGFWQDGQIVTAGGEVLELEKEIRIAHCVDLYESKNWSTYQKYCFENKIVQPFKQIFRELYVPTEDELKEKAISRRYAGHQVQPKKTLALLKGQSWTVDYEEGLQKVNHKQNTISRMFAMADWFSPADVEAPTLETIEFFNRKNGKRLPFEKVDKRIFSETMRDIDLVVSVAHVGDVDPEASHSSIEMRSVIVAETCSLFKLKNVSFSPSHALIKGELGDYSVHLGSGVCHKVAGSSLSIIPVHSQHRGRMFLPFIDDDPKTAEIVSKVLLLAKDKEINDPTILSQL